MTLYIAPIVEGHTEVGCVERLLQSICVQLLNGPERLQVLQPSRGRQDLLIRPTGTDLSDKVGEAYGRLIRHVRRDASGRGLLLVLLDAEEDCPAELGPRLLRVARAAAPSDADIDCVLPRRMLENWFVAAASSLAGVHGLPEGLIPPEDPEDCRGSAWLERQLRSRDPARKYTKTDDAAEFVRAMDLGQCRDGSPSFDKLCRVLTARLPPPPESGPAESSPPPAPQAP
jgi:hypothetical protein